MAFVTVFHDDVAIAIVDAGKKSGSTALEYAYMSTQNIDGSWSIEVTQGSMYRQDVKLLICNDIEGGIELGHRSTMTGDTMIMEGQRFEVAPYGYEVLA